MVALGERDPDTGRIVLSPRRTLPTAQAFKREFCTHETDGRTLHHYADAFWRWSDNRYQTWSDNAIRADLQPWLHLALRYIVNRQTQEPELADFECNNGTIEGALASIRSHVYLNESLVSPAWIGEAASGRPDPRALLPFKSGTLHIPTGDVIQPTPLLFNVNALDFDYDPNAPDPLNWFDFLLTLWPGDPYQIETLQQWFGYCLTGDTSQQKILLMVGPKRSGKGTIARVLRRLVGIGNVAGPTISSLSGAFGLADLVDKSLAIVADARFGGPAMPTVTERLLQISGEDMITIDRKHRDAINLKLPTRFMILTNELPRLSDSSGALSGRFVMLHLVESFYGREDLALESKLIAELPGILKWAIEGWKMLHERGRFVQPESARELMNSLEDLTSPVGAFVRDVCEVGPECREWVDVLYEAWRQWCLADGRINPTTKQMFGRDLAACLPNVSIKRGTSNVRFYSGVKLGAS